MLNYNFNELKTYLINSINPPRKKETRCVSEPLSDRSVSGPTDEDPIDRLGR